MSGRYRLGEVLGVGGCATVYRGEDTLLGVERAVKILEVEEGKRNSLRERLRAEARAMARLAHPNVLHIYDIGIASGKDFVIMDLAEGGSLSDALTRSGPLPPTDAIRWMIQILSALAAAHSAGIVHRDVKPQNILLDGRGTALLADFGIALLAQEEAMRHTRDGVAMGTFGFMAPEQRVDARNVGAAADLYAAGATLYNLITSQTPIDLFLEEQGSARWQSVPDALRPILIQAMAYRSEDRFPDARAMAKALIRAFSSASAEPLRRFDDLDPNNFPRPSELLTGHTMATGAPSRTRSLTAPSNHATNYALKYIYFHGADDCDDVDGIDVSASEADDVRGVDCDGDEAADAQTWNTSDTDDERLAIDLIVPSSPQHELIDLDEVNSNPYPDTSEDCSSEDDSSGDSGDDAAEAETWFADTDGAAPDSLDESNSTSKVFVGGEDCYDVESDNDLDPSWPCHGVDSGSHEDTDEYVAVLPSKRSANTGDVHGDEDSTDVPWEALYMFQELERGIAEPTPNSSPTLIAVDETLIPEVEEPEFSGDATIVDPVETQIERGRRRAPRRWNRILASASSLVLIGGLLWSVGRDADVDDVSPPDVPISNGDPTRAREPHVVAEAAGGALGGEAVDASVGEAVDAPVGEAVDASVGAAMDAPAAEVIAASGDDVGDEEGGVGAAEAAPRAAVTPEPVGDAGGGADREEGDEAPGGAASALSFPGRWIGSFSGRIAEVQLTGSDASVRGTFTVRFGSNAISSEIQGSYELGSRTLTLRDVEQTPDSGIYVIQLSADGARFEGSFEGDSNGRKVPVVLKAGG